jgi:hypothetical protein
MTFRLRRPFVYIPGVGVGGIFSEAGVPCTVAYDECNTKVNFTYYFASDTLHDRKEGFDVRSVNTVFWYLV